MAEVKIVVPPSPAAHLFKEEERSRVSFNRYEPRQRNLWGERRELLHLLGKDRSFMLSLLGNP